MFWAIKHPLSVLQPLRNAHGGAPSSRSRTHMTMQAEHIQSIGVILLRLKYFSSTFLRGVSSVAGLLL